MISDQDFEYWKTIVNNWISCKTMSITTNEKKTYTIPETSFCIYCERTCEQSQRWCFCSKFCNDMFFKNTYPYSDEIEFMNINMLTTASKNKLQDKILQFPHTYSHLTFKLQLHKKTVTSQRIVFLTNITFYQNFKEIESFTFELHTQIKICVCQFVDVCVSSSSYNANNTQSEKKDDEAYPNVICKWCTRPDDSDSPKTCLFCKEVTICKITYKAKKIIIGPFCSKFCCDGFLFQNRKYDILLTNHPNQICSINILSNKLLLYLKKKTYNKSYFIDCKSDNQTKNEKMTIQLRIKRVKEDREDSKEASIS